MDDPSATPGLRIVISCEHGGNRIPAAYQHLFDASPHAQALLHSHRGFDAGALLLARQLARALNARLFAATTTRLLVDLNRSPGHPSLLSEISRFATPAAREEIIARHYQPYRQALANYVAAAIAAGERVLHISSHSFTPMLDDSLVRTADVAFLYDPSRGAERALCQRWTDALAQRSPQLRLRRNYPYRGQSDGFCAWLRRRHSGAVYTGIELEMNQALVVPNSKIWRQVRRDLIAALQSALAADDGRAPFPQRAAVARETGQRHEG